MESMEPITAVVITCKHCGQEYPVGLELASRTPATGECYLCRAPLPLDQYCLSVSTIRDYNRALQEYKEHREVIERSFTIDGNHVRPKEGRPGAGR